MKVNLAESRKQPCVICGWKGYWHPLTPLLAHSFVCSIIHSSERSGMSEKKFAREKIHGIPAFRGMDCVLVLLLLDSSHSRPGERTSIDGIVREMVAVCCCNRRHAELRSFGARVNVHDESRRRWLNAKISSPFSLLIHRRRPAPSRCDPEWGRMLEVRSSFFCLAKALTSPFVVGGGISRVRNAAPIIIHPRSTTMNDNRNRKYYCQWSFWLASGSASPCQFSLILSFPVFDF